MKALSSQSWSAHGFGEPWTIFRWKDDGFERGIMFFLSPAFLLSREATRDNQWYSVETAKPEIRNPRS